MNPADLFSQQDDMVRLAHGDVLFKEGERGDAMFVLLEGTMDILIGDKVVENSQRGAIIGELALIDQSPRGATAIARGPARLAKVDQRRFHFLIQQNPFFATHVMKELADRLRQMNRLYSGR
ncbi:MAG: cyclic nucleotide-binding domain-containing protein [Verrucomicrobiia bacterium]